MKRSFYHNEIREAFDTHPVVALLGPRQCGKTTLAEMYAASLSSDEVHFFDLEDPTQLAQLAQPKLALEELQGLIIIDEIQLCPDLFPLIRVLVDRFRGEKRFLILGSASRDLISQSSETLAGRIAHLELPPFSHRETDEWSKLWLRGGFPPSFLAEKETGSYQWRKHYLSTFLERDVQRLGVHLAPLQLHRFWTMLAHYHGQVFNTSDIANSMDISAPLVRKHVDILTGVFLIRQLTPWFENIKKRQVKSPKLYFRDSGLFHTLLGIGSRESLHSHPKLGASWEGFALEEVIRHHRATVEECFFWGTHGGAELDLLIVQDGRRFGFEFKYTDSPRWTKSMVMAWENLKLDSLCIIFPGKGDFPVSERGRAVGLGDYLGESNRVGTQF